MAITYTWEINGTCSKRDVSDGYFTNVVYRVKGMDGETEKWRETGAVSLPKPDTLVAYDSLDKDTIIGWVKAKIDADAAEMGGFTCADIEKKIDDAITELETPSTAEGTPWGEEVE